MLWGDLTALNFRGIRCEHNINMHTGGQAEQKVKGNELNYSSIVVEKRGFLLYALQGVWWRFLKQRPNKQMYIYLYLHILQDMES